MCIICNCDDAGDEFLSHFVRARMEMRLAAESMQECLRTPLLTEDELKLYKRAHHKMRRLIKDWNRIEQEREVRKALDR